MSSPAAQQFWDQLRLTTQSRIGLGRAGNALPTTRVLEFNAHHAAARDAVHIPLDVLAFAASIAAVGIGEPSMVESQASSRSEYLRRPDLSVADSLGIYLTHLPRPGRTDADRNCISNIHPPEGLGYAAAARVVAGLVAGARRLGRSGVDLKDTSRADELTAAPTLTLE